MSQPAIDEWSAEGPEPPRSAARVPECGGQSASQSERRGRSAGLRGMVSAPACASQSANQIERRGYAMDEWSAERPAVGRQSDRDGQQSTGRVHASQSASHVGVPRSQETFTPLGRVSALQPPSRSAARQCVTGRRPCSKLIAKRF